MMKQAMLIITNLVPHPWDKTFGMFNLQQFELLAKNYEIEIFCPVPWFVAIKERLFCTKEVQYGKLKINYFPFIYIPKFLQHYQHHFLKLSIKLYLWRKLQKYNKNSIVLGTWLYPNGLVSNQLANAMGAKNYIKLHGSDVNYKLQNYQITQTLQRNLSNLSGVISVSKALLVAFKQKLQINTQFSVVYNGIKTELFNLENTDKAEYFLYIGTLKTTKGILDLLYAYKIYSDEGGEVPLKIIGKGVLHLSIKTFINENKLSSKVELVGEVRHTNIPAYLKSAFSLCLPSYNEGLPNVMLESFACGKPVLATAVGGVPEIINTDNSVTVIAGNIDSIKNGLFALESGSWDTQKIHSFSETFSWQTNYESMVDIFTGE